MESSDLLFAVPRPSDSRIVLAAEGPRPYLSARRLYARRAPSGGVVLLWVDRDGSGLAFSAEEPAAYARAAEALAEGRGASDSDLFAYGNAEEQAFPPGTFDPSAPFADLRGALESGLS
jgi:hypothetical protein